MEQLNEKRAPWNRGRLVGQKAPLTLQQIWSIRMHLEECGGARNLALFNLAIDSKLRASDLVSLRVSDIASGLQVLSRGKIIQQKTGRPVRFEISKRTKQSLTSWLKFGGLSPDDFLFPSRQKAQNHLSTRQYSRILKDWVIGIGLDASRYGTHSMRRTKATLLYRQTKNLRAVQLLLGHTNLDSTVRYLGIEINDALELSEQIDV
jgi:integrase